MAFEPRGKTKQGLDAMDADPDPARIWMTPELAKVMEVMPSAVPAYFDSAVKHQMVYRRLGSAGKVEWRRKPFDGPSVAAPLTIPTFGKYVPPKMTAPRAGSDIPAPSRAPGPPPSVAPEAHLQQPSAASAEQTDTGKRSTSAATASGHELPDDTAVAAASLSVANGGVARVASAGSAHQWTAPDAPDLLRLINSTPALQSLLYDLNLLPECVTDGVRWAHMVTVCDHMLQALARRTPAAVEASTTEEGAGNQDMEDEADDALEFAPWFNAVTGELLIFGATVNEDGSVSFPAEQVATLRRCVAWLPA